MNKKLLLFFLLLICVFSSCKKKDEQDDLPSENEEQINVECSDLNIVIGQKITLTYTNNATTKLYDYKIDDDTILNWTSDDYTSLKGYNTGVTTLIITSKKDQNISKEFSFHVWSSSPNFLFTTTTVEIGQSLQVILQEDITLRESNLNEFVITDSNELFNKTNELWTAKKLGQTNITLTSIYNNIVSSSYILTVTDDPSALMLESDKEIVGVGEGVSFKLKNNLSSSLYTWSVSPQNKASITENYIVYPYEEGYFTVNVYETTNPKNKITYTIYCDGSDVGTDYVARILNTAIKEKGTVEEYNNRTKYGAWYNNNGEAWCNTFVSWCLYQSGVSTDIMLKYQGEYTGMYWCVEHSIMHFIRDFSVTNEVTHITTTYKKENYTPVSGDIVFFLSSGMGHTGLVIYADENYLYTVEGNHSDKVDCWRWDLDDARITGYAHPNYASHSNNPQDFKWIVSKEINGTQYWTNVTLKEDLV